MPAHTGRLLLTPQDPHEVPDVSRLSAALRAAGFLGARLPGRDGAFLVGEQFLNLLSFAGCSVQLELAPNAGNESPFCHVRLTGPFEHPRLMQGRNTRPPRCPSCRAALQDWGESVEMTARAQAGALTCPACGHRDPPWDWDWKGNAGFGRFFIEVEEVFPGEATPAPTLMEILTRATASPWRYFYVQDL